ncbi:MAG TPA: hypothetical protein VJ785_01540 [Anaerolineales bacterium]|nr:hypothetical protein [Anaerolineales bacterium]
MVKLFREKNSPQADAIEAEFKDIILGYDRVVIDPAEAAQRFGSAHSLPVITNNEKVVSGDAINSYIHELQDLMTEWQAFQGDSCYVNENGKVCFI